MGGAGLLIGYIVVLVGYQNVQQSHLSDSWGHDHPLVADAVLASTGTHHAHLADGQAVAKLSLPTVGYDGIVAEGADRGILTGGPGHDDRTAYPGEGGVVLISNHNGFSMSWNNLQAGDAAVVEMPYGRYRYRITSRTIVPGDDTGVLDKKRSGETLLLTTCWPLWQGNLAGERLVFEARPA
ncbi:MAG: sortase [Candidatus Dormibacteria bacterium]